MTRREATAHNLGVRRTVALARNTADVIETEAGSGTERDKAMIEALRTLADQAEEHLMLAERESDPADEVN